MTDRSEEQARNCVYCGHAHAGELPYDCPGCGRRLTLAVNGDTNMRDLVKALFQQGFQLSVKFERDGADDVVITSRAPSAAHPGDPPEWEIEEAVPEAGGSPLDENEIVAFLKRHEDELHARVCEALAEYEGDE